MSSSSPCQGLQTSSLQTWQPWALAPMWPRILRLDPFGFLRHNPLGFPFVLCTPYVVLRTEIPSLRAHTYPYFILSYPVMMDPRPGSYP